MATDIQQFRFLDLPHEIRDNIYKLVLVRPRPFNIVTYLARNNVNSISSKALLCCPGPYTMYPPAGQPGVISCFHRQEAFNLCRHGCGHWYDGECLALLLVSKRVSREAAAVLYSGNRFAFPVLYDCYHPVLDLAWFLSRIGRRNAGRVRALCTAFPLHSRDVSPLWWTAHRALDRRLWSFEGLVWLLGARCAKLRSIEFLPSSDAAKFFAWPVEMMWQTPGCLPEARILVEATINELRRQFGTLASLEEVRFHVHHGEVWANGMRWVFLRHGWEMVRHRAGDGYLGCYSAVDGVCSPRQHRRLASLVHVTGTERMDEVQGAFA